MSANRDFLGPFQLVRLIRSGTTTQVWEAIKQDASRENRVRLALKVLNQEYRNDKLQIGRLKHEANVGQDLRDPGHPNVIEVYEFHELYSLPFISMELFNARNLKIELRENPNQVAMNLDKIVPQCALGIRHMHQQGWVHCDIKPDNFLADDEGNVKLIDFSIAERLNKGGILSGLFGGRRPKTIRGTRSYMSPEQIRRRPVDHRSDIYSFGCTLYELMSGRTPFTANNPDELLSKHLYASPPSLMAVSGATEEMANLVSRMMAKKAEERPQSIDDFLYEFKNISIFRAGKRPVASTDE